MFTPFYLRSDCYGARGEWEGFVALPCPRRAALAHAARRHFTFLSRRVPCPTGAAPLAALDPPFAPDGATATAAAVPASLPQSAANDDRAARAEATKPDSNENTLSASTLNNDASSDVAAAAASALPAAPSLLLGFAGSAVPLGVNLPNYASVRDREGHRSLPFANVAAETLLARAAPLLPPGLRAAVEAGGRDAAAMLAALAEHVAAPVGVLVMRDDDDADGNNTDAQLARERERRRRARKSRGKNDRKLRLRRQKRRQQRQERRLRHDASGVNSSSLSRTRGRSGSSSTSASEVSDFNHSDDSDAASGGAGSKSDSQSDDDEDEDSATDSGTDDDGTTSTDTTTDEDADGDSDESSEDDARTGSSAESEAASVGSLHPITGLPLSYSGYPAAVLTSRKTTAMKAAASRRSKSRSSKSKSKSKSDSAQPTTDDTTDDGSDVSAARVGADVDALLSPSPPQSEPDLDTEPEPELIKTARVTPASAFGPSFATLETTRQLATALYLLSDPHVLRVCGYATPGQQRAALAAAWAGVATEGLLGLANYHPDFDDQGQDDGDEDADADAEDDNDDDGAIKQTPATASGDASDRDNESRAVSTKALAHALSTPAASGSWALARSQAAFAVAKAMMGAGLLFVDVRYSDRDATSANAEADARNKQHGLSTKNTLNLATDTAGSHNSIVGGASASAAELALFAPPEDLSNWRIRPRPSNSARACVRVWVDTEALFTLACGTGARVVGAIAYRLQLHRACNEPLEGSGYLDDLTAVPTALLRLRAALLGRARAPLLVAQPQTVRVSLRQLRGYLHNDDASTSSDAIAQSPTKSPAQLQPQSQSQAQLSLPLPTTLGGGLVVPRWDAPAPEPLVLLASVLDRRVDIGARRSAAVDLSEPAAAYKSLSVTPTFHDNATHSSKESTSTKAINRVGVSKSCLLFIPPPPLPDLMQTAATNSALTSAALAHASTNNATNGAVAAALSRLTGLRGPAPAVAAARSAAAAAGARARARAQGLSQQQATALALAAANQTLAGTDADAATAANDASVAGAADDPRANLESGRQGKRFGNRRGAHRRRPGYGGSGSEPDETEAATWTEGTEGTEAETETEAVAGTDAPETEQQPEPEFDESAQQQQFGDGDRYDADDEDEDEDSGGDDDDAAGDEEDEDSDSEYVLVTFPSTHCGVIDATVSRYCWDAPVLPAPPSFSPRGAHGHFMGAIGTSMSYNGNKYHGASDDHTDISNDDGSISGDAERSNFRSSSGNPVMHLGLDEDEECHAHPLLF